ncbi:MAG: hypothetical protein ACOY4R_17895 [Pseudomonadota bacterium]
MVEIVAEPDCRRARQPLSDREKAAALFRIWHGVHQMMAHAEALGDRELVHFLAVTQLLVEERAVTGACSLPALEQRAANLPN